MTCPFLAFLVLFKNWEADEEKKNVMTNVYIQLLCKVISRIFDVE